MGIPGRRPTPAPLKLARGNPGQRRIHPEPKPTPLPPPCPAWLDLHAKREWRRVVPELARIGLLTRVDMAALAGYCESYAGWRRSVLVVREEGEVITTTSGYKQPHPHVAIGARHLAAVRAFCSEFGLTPSSRTRLAAPPAAADAAEGMLDEAHAI